MSFFEETGLSAEVRRVDEGATDWAVYCAQVDAGAQVVLHDNEHDRFEWVLLVEALKRCRPERVAKGMELVARTIISI